VYERNAQLTHITVVNGCRRYRDVKSQEFPFQIKESSTSIWP